MVESRVNKSMANDINYKVQIVKYEVVDRNYATYLIKVVGPNNISFHINDRYSSIRNFQTQIKRSLPSADGIPGFPKKKFLGNLDYHWLSERSKQLGLFMNTFLAHPLVKASPLVPAYFKDRCVGEGSIEAIENLVLFMHGQPVNQPKSPNTMRRTANEKPDQSTGNWPKQEPQDQ